MSKPLNFGLQLAINAVGGYKNDLASALGISRAAVSQWYQIPLTRVLQVERVTGVRRELLRPDLFQPHYRSTKQ